MKSRKLKKLLLLILLALILSLSYCTLWVAGYSHIEQIEDDEHVGKTLLIYHKAGEFMPSKSWYFGKRSGDSYFSYSPPYPEGDAPPRVYRMMGKYRKVNHGTTRIFASSGFNQYLIEPLEGQIDRRLFFFSLPLCEEQTDLFDKDTNIKIDFVCD